MAGRRACMPTTGSVAWLSTSRVSRRAANSRWTIECGAVTACTAGSWLAACRVTATTGEFVGFIGSAIDVTDRRRQESALRQSEERYRAVVDSQTELVCRFTPDLTLTFVNEAYCRFLGKRRDEVLGSKLSALPAGRHARAARPVRGARAVGSGSRGMAMRSDLPGWKPRLATLDLQGHRRSRRDAGRVAGHRS